MKGIPVGPKGPEPQDFAKKVGKAEPSEKGKFDSMLKGAGDQSSPHVGALNQSSQTAAIQATKIQEASKIPPLEKVKKAEKSSPIKNFIGSMASSEDQLNSLVNMGLSGQKFSPQQLLTMQAGVYKATMAIDVVAKGVEQTTSGLKTLLQTQV